jgi:uncharacterized protein (DUF1330 family)
MVIEIGVHVSTADSRPVQLSALKALPQDAPVVMVNLLQFGGSGGREHYLDYAREVAPHLQRVGATVRYSGTSPVHVIGDGDRPWWDAILIVEYPTPAAFVEMVKNDDYQKVHQHRAEALDRGDLIATSEWTLAE